MREALVYYLNFVALAVVGRMSEADFLLREHGKAIRLWAEMLRIGLTTKALYRGVLLDPSWLSDGNVIEHQPERMFLSFSENRDVAIWFARTDTIISELVVTTHPEAHGYVIELPAGEAQVLFHHLWVPGADIEAPLLATAAAHPLVDFDQFVWCLQTQEEVIVEPVERLVVKPIEDYASPSLEALDTKFCLPSVRLARTAV